MAEVTVWVDIFVWKDDDQMCEWFYINQSHSIASAKKAIADDTILIPSSIQYSWLID